VTVGRAVIASTGATHRRLVSLGRFATREVISQAAVLLAGILVVRGLAPGQYAVYVLGTAAQSIASILIDSGVQSAMFAIGGRVWTDNSKFAQLLATARAVRRRLSVYVLALGVPALWALLSMRDAQHNAIAISCFAVALGVLGRVQLSTYYATAILKGDGEAVQRTELLGGGARAALMGFVFFATERAEIALLCNALTPWIQRLSVRRRIRAFLQTEATPNEQYHAEILANVRRQAPHVAFYAFQGQIALVLVSLFGTTKGVADIGALTRLGVFVSVFSSFLNTLVTPGFARSSDRSYLATRILGTTLAYMVYATAIGVALIAVPGFFLFILGESYAHLQRELLIVGMSTALGGFTNMFGALNLTRGWVDRTWMIPVATIALQCLMLLGIDVSTAFGAALFGLASIVPATVLTIWMTTRGISRIAPTPHTSTA